jgi:hypothetical protein
LSTPDIAEPDAFEQVARASTENESGCHPAAELLRKIIPKEVKNN